MSQREAAKALGLALNNYQVIERGARFDNGQPAHISRRTMLACAAIAAGLAPYGSDEKPVALSRPARRRAAKADRSTQNQPVNLEECGST